MQRPDHAACPGSILPHPIPRRIMWGGTCPQLRGPKAGYHRGESANVILMRVRYRHHVEMTDSAIPQVGSHHVLADIQIPAGGPSECGCPAAIEKHRFAVRKYDEEAIALTHVDGSKFEFTGVERGRKRMPEKDRKQRRRRESSHTASRPASGDGGGD